LVGAGGAGVAKGADPHDVVIYGGTSAAVTAAVEAKRLGKSVIVVCPDQHLGGLSSGGLGWTDTGNKAVIGGLAREFYHRVYQHYQRPEAWKWQPRAAYGNQGQGNKAVDGEQRTMWIFEPHVAEAAFESMIEDFDVPVERDRWLDRQGGVEKRDGRIVAITMLDGSRYPGKMFIDATYEGDLMAAAGVDYHVGRESQQTYGEQFNGVQTGVLHHSHHFGVLDRPISPYVRPGDPDSGVLPRISTAPPGEYGAGDDKIQAYCFRMCLTDLAENRVPFPRPAGYDPAQYELLLRIYEAGWRQTFRKFDPLPNHKTDTNNHGPMSTDNIGFNYDYPEASYERRAEIIREHETYQQGWLYFIANDPRIPTDVQQAMQRWGLAKDEFEDNGHWPHQLYIREARRMIGQFVMTENELLKRRPTPDSIGMGSYTMDSHNVQRYITPEGHVQNEGDIGVSTHGPYQIAYGSIVPQAGQADNLLVPVCVSSSHIAFGSIRMEPVFMILGHSAAAAAAIAIDEGLAVQEVPYAKLRDRLRGEGQVLEAPPELQQARRRGIAPQDLAGIVLDDLAAQREGFWQASSASSGWIGFGYHHDGERGDGESIATFAPELPRSGRYEVRLAYTPHSNRTTAAPVEIRHRQGIAKLTVNQRETPPIDDRFVSLGTYNFDDDGSARVTVSNAGPEGTGPDGAGPDGYVIIDAVQWLPVDGAPDATP